MSRPATRPCGTPAAYQRHLSNRQVPCVPCRLAAASYSRARMALMRRHRDRFREIFAAEYAGKPATHLEHSRAYQRALSVLVREFRAEFDVLLQAERDAVAAGGAS